MMEHLVQGLYGVGVPANNRCTVQAAAVVAVGDGCRGDVTLLSDDVTVQLSRVLRSIQLL